MRLLAEAASWDETSAQRGGEQLLKGKTAREQFREQYRLQVRQEPAPCFWKL